MELSLNMSQDSKQYIELVLLYSYNDLTLCTCDELSELVKSSTAKPA